MFPYSKLCKYLSLTIGVALSLWLGFYVCFVGGISYILSYITVMNGCLLISKFHIIIGSFKIILSGFVFWFVLGFFLQTDKNFHDDDQGTPTNAEAHAI